MRNYEAMVIVDARLEEGDIQKAVDRFTEAITDRSAARSTAVDRWGNRRFAYEIDHQNEGYYFVTKFSAPEDVGRQTEANRPDLRRVHPRKDRPPRVAAIIETRSRTMASDNQSHSSETSPTTPSCASRRRALRSRTSPSPSTRASASNEAVGGQLDGFFRCSCWRDMAENVAESLTKGHARDGRRPAAAARWDDQDGNKRSRVEIQVDEVGPSLRWATASRSTKSQRSVAAAVPGRRPVATGARERRRRARSGRRSAPPKREGSRWR